MSHTVSAFAEIVAGQWAEEAAELLQQSEALAEQGDEFGSLRHAMRSAERSQCAADLLEAAGLV